MDVYIESVPVPHVLILRTRALTDVDECSTNQHDCIHGTCINTTGSYACACDLGYRGAYCGTGQYIQLSKIRSFAEVSRFWICAKA